MEQADVICFNKLPCIFWSNATKISYVQRRVLVYSIMYYQLNESCISDYTYDALVKQLLRMQRKATIVELKATSYYYVMKDFEGSTGFDLYYKLKSKDRNYLLDIAKQVLKQWKKEAR